MSRSESTGASSSVMGAGSVPRRVITGVRDGRAVVLSDGPTPNAHHYSSMPGFMTSVVYSTASVPAAPEAGVEAAPVGGPILPEPGATTLLIVTFPPDSVMASSDFDGAAAGAEQVAFGPDFAATFEVENPGKHRTPTLDYDIVLDGEIWLELDEQTIHLRSGDVVVQGGTRHAWRNKGDRPATLCFVLIGSERP